MEKNVKQIKESPVRVMAGAVPLDGDLSVPENPRGIVLFAHGSGSSRLSPRNRYVSGVLQNAGLATVLFDLLTKEEEAEDSRTGHLRFNIPFLARRLVAATIWLRKDSEVRDLNLGYFGASTGAAAALLAVAELPDVVSAVVSRGGRPDLALPALSRVKAPVLLIVGGEDLPVIGMNREAFRELKVEKELVIVQGATHLFEEPGALEKVAELAAGWFLKYLGSRSEMMEKVAA